MEKQAQVMTIIRTSQNDEPTIISSNIPGSPTFCENELTFLREILNQFEEKSKKMRKESEDFAKSNSHIF